MEDGECDEVEPCERENWKTILIDIAIAAVVLTTLMFLVP